MPTQNPYISVAEATVAAEKAFGKDDVGKFKDTTDLAKAAKDAGVDLKDATKGSYSYYIRTDKAEVWITNTGDGKNAGFEATTGKKVE